MAKQPLVLIVEGDDGVGRMRGANTMRECLTFILKNLYHCEVWKIDNWDRVKDDSRQILRLLQEERHAGRLVAVLLSRDLSYQIPDIQKHLSESIPLIILDSHRFDDDFSDKIPSGPSICLMKHHDKELQEKIADLITKYLNGDQITEFTPLLAPTSEYLAESSKLMALTREKKRFFAETLVNRRRENFTLGDDVKGFAIDTLTWERQISMDHGLHMAGIHTVTMRLETLMEFFPNGLEILVAHGFDRNSEDRRYGIQCEMIFGLIFKVQDFRFPLMLLYPEDCQNFSEAVDRLRSEGEYLILPSTECYGKE